MNKAHQGGISVAMVMTMTCLPSQAGRAQHATHFHNDHRNTPKLIISPEQPAANAKNDNDLARSYLSAEHALFGLPADLFNLELTGARESLLATHYRFAQFIHNIPVENAEIIVSVSKQDGKILRVFNNTYPINQPIPLPGLTKSADDAIGAAWRHLRVHARLIMEPSVQRVYRPEGKGFVLSDIVSLYTEGPFGHWELNIDAKTGHVNGVKDSVVPRVVKGDPEPLPDFSAYNGPMLDRQEALAALRAEKTTSAIPPPFALSTVDGSGQVFDPNPVITLMRTDLQDNSTESNFTPAYRQRVLKDITQTTGTYSLSGPWVHIVEIESPVTAPSTTTNGVWMYTRGTNAFNDAMTYFHLDQSQRYIQSLGFTNASGIQNAPISVDTDGANGADQSYFAAGGNYLVFGHGCVDDSEDADVILHEYGHAILFSINNSWVGGDSGAMGEGFSDYWAASYRLSTPNGASFHPDWVFTWDGHNFCWAGRILSRTNALYDAGTI
ncbi:MAG: M36 family metallopeptidase, partial [Verrucomicrobia bacterium]|nr:M36 family metallopeptidase [Verrucomicrobiota bacterium]